MTGPALVDGRWRLLLDGVAVPGAYASEAAALAALADIQAAAEERALLAGMAFGVDGYNDARGWGDCAPGPCGHHCRDCPRCGY